MPGPENNGPRLWRIPMSRIEKTVSAHLGPGKVRGTEQGSCFSRHISMYLARHVGGWSTPPIRRFYNNRHHTTILHAVSKVERLRTEGDSFHVPLEELTATLAQELSLSSSAPPGMSCHFKERPNGTSVVDANR